MNAKTGAAVPSTGSRTGLVTLLTATMGIGPLVIYAVSTLAPLVLDSLDLTRTEFGSLPLIMFGVAALAAGTTGSLADRLGPRAVLLFIFAGSGAAVVVASWAPSLAWLWLAAVLVGLAQALSNPVTNQLIALSIPLGRQGTLLGIKQSGVQFSQLLAGLSMPLLGVALGWRRAVATCLVPVVLGLVSVPLLVPASRRSGVRRPKGAREPLQPLVALMAGYSVLTGMGTQAVVMYLPLYAFEVLGLPVTTAGLTAGLLGGIGVAARIAWGRAAERRGSPLPALAFLAFGAAAAVLAITASARLGPGLLWAGAVGFACTALGVNAVTMLTVVRGVPSHSIGRASGVIALGMYGGFMLGPITLGRIVDSTGSYDAAWLLVAALFVSAGALILVRGRTRR